jgi:hypothetical protein
VTQAGSSRDIAAFVNGKGLLIATAFANWHFAHSDIVATAKR